MILFNVSNDGVLGFWGGPAVQFYTIKSGSDLVWDSHNCSRADLQSQVLTLEPGTPVESPPSPWLRVRSSSSGCGLEQTPVGAGAYTLVASVNGVISDTNQFLIN